MCAYMICACIHVTCDVREERGERGGTEFGETLADIAEHTYDLDPTIHNILHHFQHQTIATLPEIDHHPFGPCPEASALRTDNLKKSVYNVIDQALQEALTTDPCPKAIKLRV